MRQRSAAAWALVHLLFTDIRRDALRIGAKQCSVNNDPLTERLHSHFTKAEAIEVKTAAARDDRKVSAFIRRAVLAFIRAGES